MDKTLRLCAVALAFVLLLVQAPGLRASSLHANVISMFPKNIAEFAYADLTEARKFSWYPQFKSQSLPPQFNELEQFLASAGIIPASQIEQLAWALGSVETGKESENKNAPSSEYVVGVALGSFDPEAAVNILKSRKVIGFPLRGFTLYPCGSSCNELYIAFIDSNTIAFGQRGMLERLIEVRSGADDSLVQNDQLFPLISQANGHGLFWGVLNSTGTRQAIHQLLPETTDFPQASKLIDKMQALIITVEGSSDLSAHLLAFSGSPEDAATLAQLLQAALLLRQYKASKSNSDLASLLQSVRIAPSGNALDVSLSASNEQVVNLIQHNAFIPKR
ncbi:MAG: hypothetical protein PVS2B2_01990 [Candidatus Acidiferrum sp.]